jgi:cell division protein FtsI (penicillin-binding protein 3)
MTKPWWTRALLGRTAVSNPLTDKEEEAPSPQFEAQWRDSVKRRLLIIVAFMGLWVAGLEARLVWIQVLDHGFWQDKATDQRESTEPLAAPRGDITDRDGRLFAGSVRSYDVHINLKNFREALADKSRKKRIVTDSASFARDVCAALGDCQPGEEAAIVAKLDQPKGVDALIRRGRQMTVDSVDGVRALIARLTKIRKPQGLISLKPVDLRFYPNTTMAAQVIGYASPFDRNGEESTSLVGLSGVEARFDPQLRGTPGKQLTEIDGQLKDVLTSVIKPAKPGVSLELTISAALQEIAERALEKGVQEAGALGGTAVVLDSMTGEVLAMPNSPALDLNNPGAGIERQTNRAVQDIYEPGSIFKIVTVAAALNEGVISTHTLFDTHGGRLMVEGRPTPIKEAQGHNYGTIDAQGVLVHSSNVGAAEIGLRMGPEVMLKFAQLFGFFSRPTLAQFFGERPGSVRVPSRGLPNATLATVAYGYGVNGNPLQIAAAMNVFATGGVLLRPHLIHATIENGVRTVQQAPEVVGRVISPETAATMSAMLEGVVTDRGGTGSAAALARYQVAGKTGTTAKLGADGKYSTTDYRVSFAGFVPSRHPRFTIVVVVDTPTKKRAFGGTVAAPIFKEIAEASLQYVGELPSINPLPPVMVTEDRLPSKPAAPRPPGAPAVVLNAGGVPTPTMPDLTGLTLRDALARVPAGLTMDFQGTGVVVSQSPAAGEPVTVTRGSLRLQSGGGR